MRGQVDDHAATCADCARFVDQWHGVAAELDSQLIVEPSAGFAASMREQLPRPKHPVVTFSMRTLPLATAVMLMLAVWLFDQGAFTSVDYENSVDASMTWVLEGLEDE